MVRRCPGLFVFVLLTIAAAMCSAQVADFNPHPADIKVRAVSASDGETNVAVDRIMVRVQSALLDVIAEAGAVPSGEMVFPQTDVINFKPYIVSVWVDGVAYHARSKGQDFLDGKVAEVPVFETTDSADGLDVSGMNVVVRRRERGYDLELIMQVENLARPQRTMRAESMPLRIALPAGLSNVTAELDNGPEPSRVDVRPAGELTGIVAPITPGKARITVKGQLDTGREIEFSVQCNRPVDAWSLMAWPQDLQVDSFDLSQDRNKDYAGYARWVGRALAPEQSVSVRVTDATATEAQTVFRDSQQPRSEPTTTPAPTRRFPWLTVVAAVVLFGAYLFWRIRR